MEQKCFLATLLAICLTSIEFNLLNDPAFQQTVPPWVMNEVEVETFSLKQAFLAVVLLN